MCYCLDCIVSVSHGPFLYVPHTHCVRATVSALNLVIDARFKSGMGNEETQSYQVLGSQEV